MNTWATVALLASAYLALLLVERAFPLRRATRPFLPRLLVNAAVSALAFGTAFVLVGPAAAATLGFAEGRSFGLLQRAGLTGVAEGVAAFLLLDLSFYYWHVANHRFATLWRMHNVHHIDPDLDVTTAFRFHFAEVGLSAGFRVIQVLVIGPSAVAYAIYEAAFQLGTLFHHSNVKLPLTLERGLNKALVTPRMHGIHHSEVRDENRSNFGVIFPWWDRLHGTLRLNVPQSRVAIGIPAYSQPGDNRLPHCLALPFQAQRDYWRAGDEVRLHREPASPNRDAHRLDA
jgi:sterol desaturase/sphingolipid hydroxylase (fatty acid hydroxylase superfamily)